MNFKPYVKIVRIPRSQWTPWRLLLGPADIFDGLVNLLSFGFLSSGTSTYVVIKVASTVIARDIARKQASNVVS